MSRPVRHRTPKHRVATSPYETLVISKRRRRDRMSAAERRACGRAEDARLDATPLRHEADRMRLEGPFGFGRMHPDIEYSLAVYYGLCVGTFKLSCLAIRLAAKLSAAACRAVRIRAYRARAGVDRAYARECAARLREARNASPREYLRVLRSLAAEREKREADREREALALSSQPAAAKRRAMARAKRDLAWQDWFGTLERAVAGCGTPPREPGMPQFADRPRRKGAPSRRLCAFSLKEAPTGDEVRAQYEKARGRGRVEEKIRLGSMLLDAEATVDSSLVRNDDGEIVGRNAGLRGWILDNCPELLPHYAALTGYRRLAWETREAEDLFDPIPASVLLGPEPEVEAKVPPLRRAKIEPARERAGRLLKEPESATVAGFLRRLRADREARERARWNGRRLA